MPYCNNVHGYIKQDNVNNKKESIFKPFSEFCLIFVFKTNLMNMTKHFQKCGLPLHLHISKRLCHPQGVHKPNLKSAKI